jgi:hypothetical protein
VPRLLIHVEGETEETFVDEVLRPHLLSRGLSDVSARILGNARQRDRRGGIRGWPSARIDILKHLKGAPGCFATTMVDYYGMPQRGQAAWPGRAAASALPFAQRAPSVEVAMLADVCAHMGGGFDRRWFLPYVMMHEFEALLFSDCHAFGRGISRPDLTPAFQEIRHGFPSPEEIDDSPVSAPSKRVEALVAGYQKPLLGTLAALEIGLDAMRAECPHFRSWLEELETRAAAGP